MITHSPMSSQTVMNNRQKDTWQDIQRQIQEHEIIKHYLYNIMQEYKHFSFILPLKLSMK